ncbi:hypothetical protein PHAVU_009G232600 [Phaseolus vulgaris]|uniref:Uncharacterized protein n=1 Tax=Phaseolus vulgaris TaxID=3885 RepID=V7AZL7_PHAVU|nr:hypothetical protein PHAVU_009G232600g [Phaseolus vulgaris]ESW10725.1 hypothetical protein PHAVU_009G232600g [Phaseolus vulgaris]
MDKIKQWVILPDSRSKITVLSFSSCLPLNTSLLLLSHSNFHLQRYHCSSPHLQHHHHNNPHPLTLLL